MHPIIVEGLTVHYRRGLGKPLFKAVDGLSLSISEGECVGFIGPNGAGKSTTLKSLMGFIFPTSGRLSVLGHPAGSVAAKRFTGYLPEVAQYYPFMTAREVMFLYGSAQKLSKGDLDRRVPPILEKVGLKGRENELLRKFSKGMLQRVGIAQALLGEPRILILDEVTSGLDPVGRRDIRNLLMERKAAGATIFFSSHELTEVAQLCDRIILVDGGKKLEEHRVGELLDRLSLYRIICDASAALPALPEGAVCEPMGVGKIKIELRDQEAFFTALETLRKSGAAIRESGSVRGSLEDYFVEAIGGKIT